MQTILIAGAGKSSIFLIHYLLSQASRHRWRIIVADNDAKAIKEKTNSSPFAEMAVVDITNSDETEPLVEKADLVVSLMPPHLHIKLAHLCLKHRKHLITSSYISPEMKAMHDEVKEAGLMFMCEMGLDPGIDHMTASQIIHSIQRVAGSIISFKSYCGGLIAPEDDNNPWHYKFSWNPKNVIAAGSGGAKYLSQGKEITIPYDKVFENNKKVRIDNIGNLAYYPNRDSLQYLDIYDLPDVKTFMRATLRHPNFCKGWNALVNLGLTDDDDEFDGRGHTLSSWLKYKTGYNNGMPLPQHVAERLSVDTNDKAISMMQWLGLFNDEKLDPKKSSSADLLLDVLLDKWEMKPDDKDMVLMQHEVEYMHKSRKIKLTCHMALVGENREYSAMAKTVGLPMAILTKLVLTQKLKPPTGVVIPNMPSVYRPVLTELNHHGITFKEEVE